MNTAVRALASRGLTTWTLPIELSRVHFFIFGLAMTVLISAFALVYVKDMNRRLINQMQTTQMNNVQLHNQWTQLLLTKSTLANQARVAVLAKQDFQMQMPAAGSVVMVDGEN